MYADQNLRFLNRGQRRCRQRNAGVGFRFEPEFQRGIHFQPHAPFLGGRVGVGGFVGAYEFDGAGFVVIVEVADHLHTRHGEVFARYGRRALNEADELRRKLYLTDPFHADVADFVAGEQAQGVFLNKPVAALEHADGVAAAVGLHVAVLVYGWCAGDKPAERCADSRQGAAHDGRVVADGGGGKHEVGSTLRREVVAAQAVVAQFGLCFGIERVVRDEVVQFAIDAAEEVVFDLLAGAGGFPDAQFLQFAAVQFRGGGVGECAEGELVVCWRKIRGGNIFSRQNTLIVPQQRQAGALRIVVFHPLDVAVESGVVLPVGVVGFHTFSLLEAPPGDEAVFAAGNVATHVGTFACRAPDANFADYAFEILRFKKPLFGNNRSENFLDAVHIGRCMAPDVGVGAAASDAGRRVFSGADFRGSGGGFRQFRHGFPGGFVHGVNERFRGVSHVQVDGVPVQCFSFAVGKAVGLRFELAGHGHTGGHTRLRFGASFENLDIAVFVLKKKHEPSAAVERKRVGHLLFGTAAGIAREDADAAAKLFRFQKHLQRQVGA